VTIENLAYYYVTGPVHVYVRFPTKGVGPWWPPSKLRGKIFFLGHAKEAPEPDFIPKYIPVHSSLAGPEQEDDAIQMGGEYALNIEFTRFNWEVMRAVKQFARYGRGLPAGQESYLDRGRLILQQGDAYEVWLYNSFYGTVNAAAYPDMPPGYYYPGMRTAGVLPRDLSRDVTKGNVHFTPMSVRIGVTGGWATYFQDPAYFQGLPDPG